MSELTEKEILSQAKLIWNIQYPNLEECWVEGYQNSQEQQEEDSNPYEPGSDAYRYWNDGWWAAFYEEPPLFDLTGEVNGGNIDQSNALQPIYAQQNSKKSHLFTMKRFVGVCATIAAAIAAYEMIELAA